MQLPTNVWVQHVLVELVVEEVLLVSHPGSGVAAVEREHGAQGVGSEQGNNLDKGGGRGGGGGNEIEN